VIRVFDDAIALGRAAALEVVATGRAALAERGAFRLGLPGGTTPAPMFAALADQGAVGHVDWRRTTVCFSDERAVPPDHPDSNHRAARTALLDPLRVPEARVHRMAGEAEDLDAAARAYETHLAEPLDLLVLGIGADGHTASIFPGHPAARERQRRVVAVTGSPKPPPRRLTLTPRAIAEARQVLVLAAGEEKAEAVARALEGDEEPSSLPARLLRDRAWFLDRAAAARLRSDR